MPVIGFMVQNQDRVLEYTLNHMQLVLWVMAVSLILWIPLGILVSRHQRWAGWILGLGNLVFCIPSLSLFGLFLTWPQLGLARHSAVLALVLYAMMPMLHNVYAGLRSVDRAVMEAGRGMGMTARQVLWHIQLPLSLPVVFSGIRVTAVLVTGIATVATYIGERNLGRFIQHGIARSNGEMILAGAVLVVLLALLVDLALGRIERRLAQAHRGRFQAGMRRGQAGVRLP